MADVWRLAMGAVFAIAVAARIAAASQNATVLPPFGANHTVGGAAGWFFDGAANASAANYSAWAANQSFFLGDYLIFNTNTDCTVGQTTNATTYKLCGVVTGDGCGGSGGGWKRPTEAKFLAVMLNSEGANYFFSDAGSGAQCRHGMRFEIAVAHGRGLPPVPPSYYEPLSGVARGHGEGWIMGVVFGLAVAILIA